MAQLKLAGETGALDNINASQAQFRKQIAALNDLMRQIVGNAAVSAGALEAADPLSAPFTLYVNPYIGSDRFVGGSYNTYEATGTDEEIIASKLKRLELQRLECGYTPQRPFKTINRAVIEAAIITSKDWYTYTDPRAHVDCVSIVLSPGVHTVYNDPGSGSTSLASWGTSKNPTIAELIDFNPASVGGVLLPRGCSLCGPDLRKTTLRPNWVPGVGDEASNFSNRRGMLKITGTGYFFGFTVMDKVGATASHHLLDAFHFGSKAELDTFYAKCLSTVGGGADLSAALTVTRGTEHEIVGPIVAGETPTAAWDTTASASPYIFNCSIRSDYGMCGAFMDGSKVSGLKSMVCANFTGVSLQKDMSCWQRYSDGQWTTTTYAQYISTSPNDVRMNPDRLSRHITAINDAFIQEVSVFAIGHGIHHFTDMGGEITVTNSNSSFGGCASYSRGYKSYPFPQDRNWTVSKIKVPLDISAKTGNVRRIYLGTVAAVTSTRITLDTALAVDSDNSTVPAILLKDGYSLRSGTKIWVENPVGDHWQTNLTSSAWSSANPDRINISSALTQAGTGLAVGETQTTPAQSLAIGKRVYIRRLVDTRTPNERRVSLLLNNTASSRLPERNFVLQTDPARTGGAISRPLDTIGAEVLLVTTAGTGPAAGVGVAKTAELTIRRGAASANYQAGTFYRVGSVVKHQDKHYQSLKDQTATGSNPDPKSWGETFVHTRSTYNAEDSIKNEGPIITIDTDTDANYSTTTCGVVFNDVWQGAEYRSGTDYLGVHAFLVALGFSSSAAHAALVPRTANLRERDPSSAVDFPTAPAGGAATGRGNWAIEFRRPSVLRLYGHAWEWAGFLNYSKSIPAAQQELSPQNKFTYYFTNENGGRVVPQGSNEDGFNVSPRGLEDVETGATLSVEESGNSTIDQAEQTKFGDIEANSLTVKELIVENSLTAPPGNNATTSTPGLVQLAKYNDIIDTTAAASTNANLDANGEQAITLLGLNLWKDARNLLAGAEDGATVVMLHVAAGTPQTGANSVPFGYSAAKHGFLATSINPATGISSDGRTGPRYQVFRTVTAALEAAAKFYVPFGSEIVISVHDSLTAVEPGPLTVGNGITPWVLAGCSTPASGVTPKVNISRATTTLGTTRLLQNTEPVMIVGGIIADLEVEIDVGGVTGNTYLTQDGGFGVGQRDTVIRWKNAGAAARLVNATCSYGGRIQTRIYHDLNSTDKALRVIVEKPTGTEPAAPSLEMFGYAGGLLGHGADIVFDFKSSDYGDTGANFTFRFEHTYTATVALKFYTVGGRGGCRTGTRIGPQVRWNLNNNPWNLANFIDPNFRENKNYNGRSFGTKPLVTSISADYGVSSTTAATLVPIELKGGCSVDIDAEGDKRAGAFGLLFALEGQSGLPAVLVKANNGDGSYVYGGSASRNRLMVDGGTCEARSTVTAASGTYSLDVTAANEFVTAAAINGAITIALQNHSLIPVGYVWRGVLAFTYTSGTITWFPASGGTTFNVKWDGGSAITPTAGEVETVVITVVGVSGSVVTVEVAPLKGRA